MIDLSLVPAEEMIKELSKRYDGFIFAGIKFANTKYQYETTRRWNGNRMALTALALILDVVAPLLHCQAAALLAVSNTEFPAQTVVLPLCVIVAAGVG